MYEDKEYFDGDQGFSPSISAGGMQELRINIQVVEKKLKELNKDKSAGPDKIHLRILWETRHIISGYLSRIFECPLITEQVVSDW